MLALKAVEGADLALVNLAASRSENAGAYRQSRIAILVLVSGVAAAGVGWWFTQRQVTEDANRKFRLDAAQAVEAIDRRVQDNVDILRGLKGLFLASNKVNRREFRLYLSSYALKRNGTGLRLVAYAPLVEAAGRAAFENRVRNDKSIDRRGYPQFTIHPPGWREEYVVVEYVEPAEGNTAALGLDLAADPERQAEIRRARDSGEPVASAPFAASVDPAQTSIAVRAAIYRSGAPVDSVAARREAFEGIVTAVIHVRELMTGVLGKQLGVDFGLVVTDAGPARAGTGAAPAAQTVLFNNHGGRPQAPAAAPGERDELALDVGGRQWRLSFSRAPAGFDAERALPLVVFLGGAVTSLLLFWLILTLTISRERALQLAQHTTTVRTAEGLREQLRFIQQLIESIPQPIFFKDAEGRYLGVNKAWERFFGIPRSRFIGRTVFELYPHQRDLAARHHAKDQELFSDAGSQSYEASIAAPDGTMHHTIYNKATFTTPDGRIAGLIGAITDITGLKEAEAALRESEARFRDLTELSSDWYWEQDEALCMTQVSSKVKEFDLDAVEDIGKLRWEFSRLAGPESVWDMHRADLQARRPFSDFQYQRHSVNGSLRTISVSGRPIFDEAGRFRGYRGTGRDITQQKESEEQIRHLAHYDALTDLPNRALLNDRVGQGIAHARRSGRSLALLFIDLDRFKNVNDSLGHATGDRLLGAVAKRLVACIRGTDTVARLGGDEFVVVLTDLGRPSDSGCVAEKVRAALADPIEIDGHDLHVTPSIGISTYPQDGQDGEALMRSADAAMYHAKEMGRNNYQFFTRAMNTAAHRRLTLESELRHALERGEFVLYYQPQLDLGTGRIAGVEALLRWRHPQRGIVGPAEFIRGAEENGLINPIGEWVLREACRQAAEWHRVGHPELAVAVNFSPQQFRSEQLVAAVAQTLRETGLPAESLEIEITESLIVEPTEDIAQRLLALSTLGTKLSLDDFGTGYSGLGYLKRYPIDSLKIDQSFVRDISSDPDDAAIVTAIVAMARSLTLTVCAEGVETADQLDFLKRLRCDRGQGYLFSRPLPADEVARLLSEWEGRPRSFVA